MLAVEPGTAQNIPAFAKIIILVLSIIAVVLTAAWGKITERLKARGKKNPEPKA